MNRPRPGTVRLWTIQDWVVWERLQDTGHLFVSYTDDAMPDFLPEYDWMREQMASRLPGYEGHYPWWARHRPKVDLRCLGTFPEGPIGTLRVQLELALSPDRVLLFSDEAWLMILNRWYIPLTESEAEAWEKVLTEEGYEPWDQGLPAGPGSLVAESWERIFDLEALCAGGLWSPNYVQAVVERLDLADVVAVTEFTVRR